MITMGGKTTLQTAALAVGRVQQHHNPPPTSKHPFRRPIIPDAVNPGGIISGGGYCLEFGSQKRTNISNGKAGTEQMKI